MFQFLYKVIATPERINKDILNSKKNCQLTQIDCDIPVLILT